MSFPTARVEQGSQKTLDDDDDDDCNMMMIVCDYWFDPKVQGHKNGAFPSNGR